jgi:bacillithiol biosynthesis cysteine-adding enzyme BshC
MEAVRAEFASGTWLDDLAPAMSATGRAAERLARSGGGRGVVVTAGQQPGLFGGPLYACHKALTALALADALERSTIIPCAPVFWAATDDADIKEASWTTLSVPGGSHTLRFGIGDGASSSMATTPLPAAEVAQLLSELRSTCGSAPYHHALEAVERAYSAGHTVGSAYLSLMRALLEPLGIAVLDASHPAVRRAGDAVLRSALRRAPAVARALHERDTDMRTAGFSPQVAEMHALSLVFREDDGGRKRVRFADTEAVAAEAPSDQLSPNVLLRPVYERAMLPTVAYAAGPAELAYFAQTGAVATALGLAAPLSVPRWAAVIVEPQVRQIMTRFGIDIDSLRDPHAIEGRLAREALPPDVRDAVESLRGSVHHMKDHLLSAAADGASALVPPAVLVGAERTILHRVARLERRLLAAVKRRNELTMYEIATARGSLWPGGRRQDRVLNMIPFLARYGDGIFDQCLAAARPHAEALVSGSATLTPTS